MINFIDWSHPVFNIPTDFDEGGALKALFEAEQQLFQNNFPQVIMAHAVSSIVANYDLVVEEFDGCSVPVLQGQPVSGKTTAMRAVLSVFGQTKFSCGEYEVIINIVM